MAETAGTSSGEEAGGRDGDAMTHSFDKDYWQGHWALGIGPRCRAGRFGRECPEPASRPRNRRTRTGYSAGCRVRDRGRGDLAGRARLAGHRRRHLRRCPRSGGRACRRAVRARQGDLGRGGSDVVGAGRPVRPCDHPLRAPGDAAACLLRTHLALGSPRRHAGAATGAPATPSSGAGGSGLAKKVPPVPSQKVQSIHRYKTVDRFARIGPGFRLLPFSWRLVGPGVATVATRQRVLQRTPAGGTPDQLAQRVGEDPASTSQS
ncbi:hypothetical protein ABH915_002552 [Arthrobacter sp. MW3 TE3886]